MNRNRTLPGIVLLFLFLVAGTVLAETLSTSTPKRIAPSEFIIFPWGWMPSDPESGCWGDLADVDAMMKDLYDCGLNTSGFNGVRNIRHARNNGLAAIVIDGRIQTGADITQEKADETVKNIMDEITDPEDRKAVYAVYIRDEPNAALFPKLNVWSEAVKKQGVLPYINLFPDYASPEQLGTKDYREHLDRYVAECKPPYISYDNYSLFEGNVLGEDRFYANMEAIRTKSLEAGIPFWNVISSVAHFNYAEPSDATLGVQVWSTLAYGGRGIGYFTYYTPQVGNYRLAPIDRFGYRTKTWTAMRNVNLQIHSLAPVYGTLKSVNVFHLQKVPKDCRGKETAVHVESISDRNFVVGEFVDAADKPYVIVVNKNLKSSVAFDINFKREGRVMLVSPFNRGKVAFQGEQRWLAPGAGALLTVE